MKTTKTMTTQISKFQLFRPKPIETTDSSMNSNDQAQGNSWPQAPKHVTSKRFWACDKRIVLKEIDPNTMTYTNNKASRSATGSSCMT